MDLRAAASSLVSRLRAGWRLRVLSRLRAVWQERIAPRLRASTIGSVAWDLIRQCRTDRVTGLAAEVAFWSVLSLFPALLAFTAALGSLEAVAGHDVASRTEEEVVGFLQRILTDDADRTVADVEGLFTRDNAGLLTISVVAALWTASRGFTAVIRALDIAYDLRETRSYLETRALGMAMAVGSVLVGSLMTSTTVVGPLLGTGEGLAERYDLGDTFAFLWDWVRWPLLFVSMVAWTTTVLHLAPNHRTRWRWDLPGAVLTTVSWALSSFGLRYYLQLSGGGNQVFSVLGGSLIALIWLYLLALGLLVGGELNACLMQRAARADGAPPTGSRERGDAGRGSSEPRSVEPPQGGPVVG